MSSLAPYKAKRNLKKTPEPHAKIKHSQEDSCLFVIQKHHASHLHYDFRLEVSGVLKSWAVPKGPSLNPTIKRLAIMVEDHPFDYKDFEGIIPEGNYGAGTVMIWDEGTYITPTSTNKKEIEKEMRKGLAKGHVDIILQGKKLKGQFTLIRTARENAENSWLLFKKKDSFSSTADITQKSDSAKTGRTMEEIAEEKSSTWKSTKKATQRKSKHLLQEEPLSKMPKGTFPKIVHPMLATLVDEPFDNKDWLFEVKWDGYRTLASIKNKKADLISRNQNSFNELFPIIVSDLNGITDDIVLDGEIVIVDKKGKSQFQLMQNYQRTQEGNILFYVFDLLYLNGHDLTKVPLIERKKILKSIITQWDLPRIRYSDHILEQGISFFKEAKKQNLEGIMAKKIESFYYMKRSRDWLKIKVHQQQEVVIGGFTQPKGSRKKFGSLLIGVYKKNKLHYAGHVGGGFTQKLLSDLYDKLAPLFQENSPFVEKIRPNSPVTWVKPLLVAEVSFTEWTSEGSMRHPIFKGLRIDKKPKEVRREDESS